MKTHSFLTSLAAAAGLLCLTSCDSKLESLNMEQFDLQTEAAEILLDCEDVEDVKDAIDDIKAKMADGTIVVPTAYGMTADEIAALVDSAK